MMTIATSAFAQGEDPHQWLEEVTGEKAIAWVKAENATSQSLLEARPEFREIHPRLLAIFNSRERIPGVQKRGKWLYNFWQDEKSPRGLWRRTTLEEYRKPEPRWETVIDVGKLGAEEKENWVWKGSGCLHPEYRRCLVSLSRGGADAVVIREFDVEAKAFVKPGFELPESKGEVAWRDADTIYLSRNFGEGTLTKSGYPRIVKEWKRGTPISEARVLYQAQESDVGAWPWAVHEKGGREEGYVRVIDTRMSETFIRRGDRFVHIEAPRDADVATQGGLLMVRLRNDWKPAERTFKAGSLISTDLDKFLAGRREFETVFEPSARVSLQSYTATKNLLVLDVLDNVKGRVIEARRSAGQWRTRNVPVPPAASVGVSAYDRDEGDDYWLTVTSFLEPTTLYLARGGRDSREKLKSLPAFFEARGLKVLQHEATSKDGTRVPYFVVMRESAKLDGSNPTLLYGYGGFEQSMTPTYSATAGAAWLEKGGVWVLSNLRGGGEFGPPWHLAARREGRHKTHDDFIAIAEDLVARKITSPRHLGIMGGSQGGLLVSVAFVDRPELFKAVVAQVPLADMKRYHKLLAGASWIGEYGNPDDPKDWEFISRYSPYQRLVKDAKYPKVLFWTNMRDDRVHPGHARKMVARMKELGHDVLYFEDTESGHAAGSTPARNAYTWALTYTFLHMELR
jgi:prolyl oligopeptidase